MDSLSPSSGEIPSSGPSLRSVLILVFLPPLFSFLGAVWQGQKTRQSYDELSGKMDRLQEEVHRKVTQERSR